MQREDTDVDSDSDFSELAKRKSRKEQLEVELAYVRWLRTQNQSRMQAMLHDTKSQVHRDARVSDDDGLYQRSIMLRHLKNAEVDEPIQLTDALVQRFAHENSREQKLAHQRKEERARQTKLLAGLNAKIEESQQRNIAYRQRKEELDALREQTLAQFRVEEKDSNSF